MIPPVEGVLAETGEVRLRQACLWRLKSPKPCSVPLSNEGGGSTFELDLFSVCFHSCNLWNRFVFTYLKSACGWGQNLWGEENVTERKKERERKREMVLHTTPYTSACLHFLDGLSWSLVFPCYWLLDRLLASCVATSLEKHQRSQDPCSFLTLCVVISAPLYLLLFLASLPFALLGFIIWAPLQAIRQPYLYTYRRLVWTWVKRWRFFFLLHVFKSSKEWTFCNLYVKPVVVVLLLLLFLNPPTSLFILHAVLYQSAKEYCFYHLIHIKYTYILTIAIMQMLQELGFRHWSPGMHAWSPT